MSREIFIDFIEKDFEMPRNEALLETTLKTRAYVEDYGGCKERREAFGDLPV